MTFEGTVRLDIIEDDRDTELFMKFLKKYPRTLVYREIAKQTQKPHYQGIIWHDDEKAFNACKTRFTTMFKATHPKSLKSMAIVKKESYKAYVSKDGDLFYSSGVTDEEVAQWQTDSYQPSLNASDCSRKLTWVERVLLAYDDLHSKGLIPDPLDEQVLEEKRWGTLEVARFVASQLGSLNKPFSDRLVVDTTNLIFQTRSSTIRDIPLKQWQQARERQWLQLLAL